MMLNGLFCSASSPSSSSSSSSSSYSSSSSPSSEPPSSSLIKGIVRILSTAFPEAWKRYEIKKKQGKIRDSTFLSKRHFS